MATLTIDPIDITTYLESSNPDTNSGSGTGLKCGLDSGKGTPKRRPLLKADISSIAAGSTIDTTSKLRLYLLATIGATIPTTVHRITQAGWTELGATWNKYDGTNNWATAGGDYSTPTVAYTVPASGGAQWVEITGANMAAYLQDALDNRSGIVHMLIRVDDEATVNAHEYTSDDYGDTALRPKLVVDYTTPGAAATRSQGIII